MFLYLIFVYILYQKFLIKSNIDYISGNGKKEDPYKIEMDLNKVIVLPSNYLEDDIHLNSIKFSLKKHYEYLDKDVVNYSVKDDRIVVNVLVDEDETIVLNNIEFFENDGKLEMKINSNTRSSDVVTLSIGDKYTEGEFITRMKNNGYVCK